MIKVYFYSSWKKGLLTKATLKGIAKFANARIFVSENEEDGIYHLREEHIQSFILPSGKVIKMNEKPSAYPF